MPTSMTMRVLASAMLGYGMLVGSVAAQSGNQVGFLSSGQTAKLDCRGGPAQIMGSTNVLTISGKCTALNVAGSGNRITIEFTPNSTISVAGSNNAISWTGTDGKSPKLSTVGSSNTLTPPIDCSAGTVNGLTFWNN